MGSSLLWAAWSVFHGAAGVVGFLGIGEPEKAPPGPVDLIVVSLADQAFAAYAGEQRVLRGPISSGMAGYQTTTGSFKVTNKHREWVSTLYDVPMPHFLRLNGGAMGLHGGYLPGFAASHGCVRLVFQDAEKLFELAPIGARVEITADSTKDTKGVKQPPSGPIYYRVVGGKKVFLSEGEVLKRKKVKEGRYAETGARVPR
jgi:hypothetical protein